MGLGKPVIQLCQSGEKLHFDIAQKNTIIWETEEDIPLRLKIGLWRQLISRRDGRCIASSKDCLDFILGQFSELAI